MCPIIADGLHRTALARRYSVPAFGDWRELIAIKELDAVFITTLPDTHAEITLAALEHGKHVFSEPPLAITMADADSIVEAARSRGLVVQVGHSPVLRPESLVVAEQLERLGGPVLDDIRIQFPNDSRRGRTSGFDIRVTGHPFVYAVTLGLPAIFGKGPIASIRASALGLSNDPLFESCVANIDSLVKTRFEEVPAL